MPTTPCGCGYFRVSTSSCRSFCFGLCKSSAMTPGAAFANGDYGSLARLLAISASRAEHELRVSGSVAAPRVGTGSRASGRDSRGEHSDFLLADAPVISAGFPSSSGVKMKSHSKGEKPTVSAAERRKKEARSSSGREWSCAVVSVFGPNLRHSSECAVHWSSEKPCGGRFLGCALHGREKRRAGESRRSVAQRLSAIWRDRTLVHHVPFVLAILEFFVRHPRRR